MNENELLFSMEIEVNNKNKRKEKINIYNNSNIEKIAYDFCMKNQLDFKSHNDLINKLKNELNNNKLTVNNNNNNDNKVFYNDIYTKNLLFLKNKEEKLNEIKKNLNDSEKEEETFQPKINKNSNLLFSNNNIKSHYKNFYEIISNYKDYKQNKEKKLKNKYNIILTFHPKINSNYRYNKHSSLHKRNKNFNLNDINFNINDSNINSKNNNINSTNFNEIKLINTNFYVKNDKKIKTNYEQNFTFIPKINKKSKNKNTKSNKNIFIRLYEYKKKEIAPIKYNNIKTNKSSINIYNNKKEKIFEKIFKILDKDEDNFISRINLLNLNLPLKISNFLNPLFNIIKTNDLKINKNEFIEFSNLLFNKLNYDDKNFILHMNYK